MDDNKSGSTSSFAHVTEEQMGGKVRADVTGKGRMMEDPYTCVVHGLLILLIF